MILIQKLKKKKQTKSKINIPKNHVKATIRGKYQKRIKHLGLARDTRNNTLWMERRSEYKISNKHKLQASKNRYLENINKQLQMQPIINPSMLVQ